MRPLSQGHLSGPSTVWDAQTWLRRVRKLRDGLPFSPRGRLHAFLQDVGPGPRVWPLISQVVFCLFRGGAPFAPFDVAGFRRMGRPVAGIFEGWPVVRSTLSGLPRPRVERADNHLIAPHFLPGRSSPLSSSGQPLFGLRHPSSPSRCFRGSSPVLSGLGGCLAGADEPAWFLHHLQGCGLRPCWFAVTTVGPLPRGARSCRLSARFAVGSLRFCLPPLG